MLDESSLQRGQLKAISKILFKMQESKNNGEGVSIVRDVAKLLKKGQAKEAKALVKNHKDDIKMYPDIQRFIHDMVILLGIGTRPVAELYLIEENKMKTHLLLILVVGLFLVTGSTIAFETVDKKSNVGKMEYIPEVKDPKDLIEPELPGIFLEDPVKIVRPEVKWERRPFELKLVYIIL